MYHLNKCKSTTNGISITINGVSFKPTGSGSTEKVTIGGIACPHDSWTNTKIICTPALASQVGSNLPIKVYAKNGKFTHQSPNAKLISFLPPSISSIEPPAPGTTKGGIATTIRGANFGPSSVAVTLLSGTMPWTSVVHVDDATITAVSPALSGTHNGNGLEVKVTIGGQEGTSTYNYAAPTLTSVDPLAQTKTGGNDGILMTLHGTDFANVDLNRITIVAKGGTVDIPCSSVTRVDYETLTCMYPDGGAGGCTDRNIYVTVAGQETTEKIPLCYAGSDGACVLGTPPVLEPGFWRKNPFSSDVCKYPVEQCPYNGCLGGSNSSCAQGYVAGSPVCAICSPEFALQATKCVACPGYNASNNGTNMPLVIIITVAFLIFIAGAIFFFTRPALTDELKSKVRQYLSTVIATTKFKLNKHKLINIASFTNLMRPSKERGKKKRQDHDFHQDEDDELHLTPTELRLVFEDIGKDDAGFITLAKIEQYVAKINAAGGANDDIEEKDDIEAQGEIVADHLYCSSVSSVSMPSVPLAQLPGMALIPAEESTEVLQLLQLPAFDLGDYPSLDLTSYTMASISEIVLPSITLGDFPGISLPDSGSGSAFASFQLPAMPITSYPFFVLPNPPSLDLINLKLQAADQKVKQVKVDIGGNLMKLKLFLGFAQCVSFFPITFSTIPFSVSFRGLSRFLDLVSFDFFSVLAGSACQFVTGFLKELEFSAVVLPIIMVITVASYVVIMCTRTDKSKFTKESASTRLVSLLFMVMYTLYTSVSTKLFRLFKCREIQSQWYLTADYNVVCSGNDYTAHVALAIGGICFCTLGIPIVILTVLTRNRKYLHSSTCPEDELYKHVLVKKKYGSIYDDYTKDNYFFDLLDLGRRLLLTGALIMVGEQSNTQIFLGALLCVLWLLVVAVRRPYKAYWDNVLSIVLSLQLVLIMLCGMALEMNRLSPAASLDPYESVSFDILMVTFSMIIIVTAVLAIVISIPCIRDLAVQCWVKRCHNPEEGKANGGKEFTQQEQMLLVKLRENKKKTTTRKSAAVHAINETQLHVPDGCNNVAKTSDLKKVEMVAVPVRFSRKVSPVEIESSIERSISGEKIDQPSVELEVRISSSKTNNDDQNDRNTASDSNSSGGMVADPDKVQQLCGMGFSEDKAKDALITYNNNVERACNHLVGM